MNKSSCLIIVIRALPDSWRIEKVTDKTEDPCLESCDTRFKFLLLFIATDEISEMRSGQTSWQHHMTNPILETCQSCLCYFNKILSYSTSNNYYFTFYWIDTVSSIQLEVQVFSDKGMQMRGEEEGRAVRRRVRWDLRFHSTSVSTFSLNIHYDRITFLKMSERASESGRNWRNSSAGV